MKKNIEMRMRRKVGASPEKREQIAKAHADWYGVCRRCGTTIQGTLSDLHNGCANCKGGPHAEDHLPDQSPRAN